MLTFGGIKKIAMLEESQSPLSFKVAGFTILENSSKSKIIIARILPGKVKGSTAEIVSPIMQMPKISAS